MSEPDLRVELSGGQLGRPLYANAKRWLLEWELIEADDHAGLVTFPLALWKDLGPLPPPDPADEERWVSQHDALALLLGIEGQSIGIASLGHVGAAGMRFQVEVDGRHVAPSGKVLPFVWHLAQQIETHNARGSTKMEEQLALLGDLKSDLARAQGLLAGTRAAISVAFDAHLDEFKIERVGRVAPVVQGDAKGRVFSVELERRTEGDKTALLPVSELSPEAPIIAMGSREFLLLSPDVETVAREAQKKRNLLRRKAEPLLRDPTAWLPQGLEDFDGALDLSRYSDRVIGFAPLEFTPDLRKSSGIEWYREDGGPFLRLEIPTPYGSEPQRLEVAKPADAARLLAELQRRLTAGDTQAFSFGDQQVIPTPALERLLQEHLQTHHAREVDQPVEEPSTSSGDEPREEEGSKRKRLGAVLRDSDEVESYATRAAIDESKVPWDVLTACLREGISLKPHQRAGIAWLWNHATEGSRGVLLADDMGLGKTLQLACFMALRRRCNSAGEAQPCLVAAPVILLDNWLAELERFFRADVFGEVLRLHGEQLRKIRVGQALDVSRIKAHGLVLTNYETLAGNQPTLLSVDWDVVVLDEAQAIKNPETGRAVAARGLKKKFGICATGTPVENRLSDLWSLYDFLSPGQPFTTHQDFKRKHDDDPDTGVELVRKALAYPSPQSSLLRREKAELDLPSKTYVHRKIAMTPQQASREQIIARSWRNPGDHLRILQDLQKLYQHPHLLTRAVSEQVPADPDWEQIMADSPKVQLCLQILEEIEAKREKALLFTLWIPMQALLAEVIRRKFGLRRVRIINGDPSTRRHALRSISELSESSGFDVLVLSPLAAGTGLNIVAANHVIHYGRWWNPAKEDQATDRAYRIGQTKPVTVYYPLLHHPGNPEAGFDLRLHELVSRKRAIARDFLRPQGEQDLGGEDLRSILGEA